MGFEYAGSLTGGAPVTRLFQIGETLYTGQLLMSGLIGGASGAVQIADAASEAHENDQPIIGVCSGVHVIDDAGWNTTNKGDTATLDVGQAAQIANDPVGATHVETTLIIPNSTLIRAPIYNAAYGTDLTECAITTLSTDGLTVTHASDTVTDIADDLAIVYCRTGANRGHYRVSDTPGANAQTVTIAFPYDTVVGDKFIVASCVFGIGGLDFPATANCIDGNNDLNAYYDVYYHDINLEEKGKEFAVLSFASKACEAMAA